jgi:NADH-quinone oxidoreductase subunit N
MKTVYLEAISQSQHWGFLGPEIALGVLALVLLVSEMLLPVARREQWIPRIANAGLLVVLVGFLATLIQPGAWVPAQAFGGMVEVDRFTQFMRAFFLLSAVPVLHFFKLYFESRNLPRTEAYALVVIATAGMMLLAMSRNFVLMFVALETVTIAFYVLVSYCRSSVLSLEAGLKYVVLGAASSAILLFGMVLLYGVAGNPALAGSTANGLDFGPLAAFIALNPDHLLVKLGAVLVLAGIAFKIGAVPFQIWIPDVYQGAPTPVMAFLGVSSKAAGFVMLVVLLKGPFVALGTFLVPLLSVITVLTILYGNLAALGQTNLKRLMGLSGIAHAGYLLLAITALAAGIELAVPAVVVYLVTYLFGSTCVVGVMMAIGEQDEHKDLASHRKLLQRSGFLCVTLVVGLASLAGIPPLAGFIGKLFVFTAAAQAGLWVPLIAAAIGVAISICYYFGWMREALFSDKLADGQRLPPIRLSPDHKLALASFVVVTILLGFIQGGI